MANLQSSASTASVIRPEFSLYQVVQPQGFLNKQTGILLPAGTIYARIYFPKGCSPVGSTIKGKVVYDSRKNQLAKGNESFELHIVCSDVAQYRKLYITCGKSNMLGNRRRTDLLMRDLNNNGIGIRGRMVINFPKPGTRNVPIPADAPEPVETELVASPDHVQPTPATAVVEPVVSTSVVTPVVDTYFVDVPVADVPVNTELKFVTKYAPRTLRRICKNFGILTAGIKDNQIKQYTYDQLVARGVSAVAVKQMFRSPKF